MTNFRMAVLPLAVAAVTMSSTLAAATDEERINRLEAIVEKQQKMIDALSEELEQLKGQKRPVQVEQLDSRVVSRDEPQPSPPEAAPGALEPLSLKVYGFAMADAIYDFKRVDPNWEDTLRVSTIPTSSGAFGEDGNFTFGVRQSRLGISGDYGDDISFLLEAELFGVGGDEGQTTPRLRHAWATYKNLGAGQYNSNFMDIDIFPNTIDYWGPPGWCSTATSRFATASR